MAYWLLGLAVVGSNMGHLYGAAYVTIVKSADHRNPCSWGVRIKRMTKPNPEIIQSFKKIANEKTGRDLSEQEVASFFDPTLPAPNIPKDQIDELAEWLLGENQG